jgi:hypothetical protein
MRPLCLKGPGRSDMAMIYWSSHRFCEFTTRLLFTTSPFIEVLVCCSPYRVLFYKKVKCAQVGTWLPLNMPNWHLVYFGWRVSWLLGHLFSYLLANMDLSR